MYDWENRAYDFDLYANSSWRWDDYRYRYYTRGDTAPADDVYISPNGSSFASGTFARALNKMKESR
jgi:hypothetical protein